MIVLRWLIFSILVFIGGSAILANWLIALRPRGSHIPIIGGVIVAIAVILAPWDALRSLWWVPLIVDLGCAPMLLLTGSYWTWYWLSKRLK